jgi:hypothetical protein
MELTPDLAIFGISIATKMPRKRDDRKTIAVIYGERFERLIVIDEEDDPAGCRAVRV